MAGHRCPVCEERIDISGDCGCVKEAFFKSTLDAVTFPHYRVQWRHNNEPDSWYSIRGAWPLEDARRERDARVENDRVHGLSRRWRVVIVRIEE